MIRDIKAIFEQKGTPVLTRIVVELLITMGVIITAMISGGFGGFLTTLIANLFKTSKTRLKSTTSKYSKHPNSPSSKYPSK